MDDRITQDSGDGVYGEGANLVLGCLPELADFSTDAESARSCGFLFALTPDSLAVADPGANVYAPKLSGAAG